MRIVQRVVTRDGAAHNTLEAARRHADARYTKAACELASALVMIEKYQDVKHFIDANLGKFLELAALKADLECENPEDEHSA